MLPLQKLSSKSDNESGEKVGNVDKQTMWGNRGVKWRVLGLHLSDLDQMLDKHTLGDEERSCVSPMSVIMVRSTLLQVDIGKHL